MKRNFKSVLAVILSVCMMLSCLSIAVFADENITFYFDGCNFTDLHNATMMFPDSQGSVNLIFENADADPNTGTLTIPRENVYSLKIRVDGEFDSDNLTFVVCGINNYRDYPSVDGNGYLDFSQLIFPDGDIHLSIESAGGPGPVPGPNDGNCYIFFEDAEIDGNTVTFNNGGNPVVINVTGATIEDGSFVISYDDFDNVSFEIVSGFDSNTMNLYALGLDGYQGILSVEGNVASFAGLTFPPVVYISLDDYMVYICAVDGNDIMYFDGETLTMFPGESIFVSFLTDYRNEQHGICPIYGFNYGIPDANFDDSLTSMGFLVEEGEYEQLGFESNDWFNGMYGMKITVPDDLEIGTRARVPYSLYELPEGFDIENPFATFSFSDTPTVLTNELFVEVVENPVYLSNDGLWEYSLYEDGTAYLTSSIPWGASYKGNESVVTVPSAIDGHKLVALEGCCFANLDFIKEIIIPDGIKIIGFSAFSGCTSLEKFNVPESVNEIGAQTIDNTAIAANPDNYEDGGIYVDNCLIRINPDFTGTFTVKDGTRLIAYAAGNSCQGIEHIIVPESVTELGMAVFHNCTSLKTATIPQSVSFIADMAFGFFDEQGNLDIDLETIYGYPRTAAEDFAHAHNIDFVPLTSGKTGDCDWVYDPDTKTLTVSGNGATRDYDRNVYAPWRGFNVSKVIFEDGVTRIGNDNMLFSDVSEVVIADSVEEIGVNAFNVCSNLTKVTLPANLKKVDSYAFGSTAIKTVEIPKTLTEIGECAFGFVYDGELDKDVVLDGFKIYGYAGTKAEEYATENEITFIPLGEEKNFPDVPKGAWFYDAADYCAKRGFINGYGNGNFGATDPLQRQDFVVILANIAKADLSSYTTCKLTDVDMNAYYGKAVAWAVDKGIIAGYQNGKFGVGDPINREQVATILYRYMKNPAVSDVDGKLAKFPDKGNISEFAKAPLAWAVENNIISGMQDGTVAPKGTAVRAQIASIIMNMDKAGMFYV